MKTTDRSILVGFLLLVLALGFWFMILGPKRQKATELSDEAAMLQTQVDEQESQVAFGEEARKDFPKYYGRLVVLGKAVPDQADSASLLVQVSDISRDASVKFLSLELGDGAPAVAEPAAPDPSVAEAASSPSTEEPTSEESTTTTTTTTTAPPAAPATEADAATLPIGSTIGPAGLGVLNYNLIFTGSFFDTADFIAGIDKLITLRDSNEAVANGRLLTIDGFSMIPDPNLPYPKLQASFVVNAYSAPSSQGLTLGATPGAPAPVIPGATPASTVSTP